MKILVTGLGSIGQRHIRNLLALYRNQVEVIAYRSRGLDLVIGEKLIASSGISPENYYHIRSYSNLKEALSEKPDAVLITNPNSLHIPTALAAAEHDCHLFIEKPLSHDLEGTSQLQKIVDDKDLVVLVGFQLRFHPAFQQAYKMIQEGRIGQIISASFHFGTYLPGQHPYEDYSRSYTARSDQGGGAIVCLTHEIDLVYWYFGMPKKVFAVGGHLSNLKMDVEDTVSILMQYDFQGREVPVSVYLDFVEQPPRRVFSIIGDQGKMDWDYYGKEMRLYETKSQAWTSFRFDNFERNQEFLDEMRHFIDCLNGKGKPVVNLQNGVDGLTIALAAKKSMLTGVAVRI